MKQVRFWEIWDWKSIRGGIGLILFMAGLFLFLEKYPDFVRREKSKGLISVVDAEVISVKAIEGMSQSRFTGNRITQDYYAVDYSYKVNEQTYFSGDKIPNSLANTDFINKLLRGELKKISVRYDPLQPKKSQIVIDK